VDGVNFSLICAVIFRAIKDLPDSEEGNVLGLRFWLCCVGEDMLGFGLFSWEISVSNTMKNVATQFSWEDTPPLFTLFQKRFHSTVMEFGGVIL